VVDVLNDGAAAGWRAPGSSLTVTLAVKGATCVLSLRGALTGSSAAALETQIDQLGSISCRDVVLDLSALDDVDAIGTGILFGLQHYVRGRGGNLTMVGARDAVALAVAVDPLAG
jgi:anti-anti-sigma factor